MDIRQLEEVKTVLQETVDTTKTLVAASRGKDSYHFGVYLQEHPNGNTREKYYTLIDLSSRVVIARMRDLNNILKYADKYGIDPNCIVLQLRD